MAAGFTVGMTFGGGGVVSSLIRGEGVGASPRFELRLLFEPKLPITVAGVDCTRAFAFAPLVLFAFSLAFAVGVRGVADESG